MADGNQKEILSGNTGLLLGFGVGIVAGVILLVMLPGIPWAWRIEGDRETLDLIAQQSMATAAWWMVLITAASAVGGFVALYFVLGTWKEAKRSADAADRAVTASFEAVEVNREAARSQIRAYISISRAALQRRGANFELVFEYQNSGQTPAKEVWVNFELFAGPSDENCDLICHDGESRSDLPSGQSRIADFDLDSRFTERLSVLCAAGRTCLFVELEVLFDDVFGNALGERVAYYTYISELSDDITLYRELREV